SATWATDNAIACSASPPRIQRRLPASSPVIALTSVPHPETPVNRDHRAADVAGRVAREPGHGRRHLVNAAEPASRYRVQVLLAPLFGQYGGHIGLDVSGGDHVRG